MTYRKRLRLVLGGVTTAVLGYWGLGYVVGYTDDAYVLSDVVSIAPQVTGRIAGLHVVDNETVAKGAPLATIDPQPFELALALRQAKRTEAVAALAVDRDAVASAEAERDAALAAQQLAKETYSRVVVLTQKGDVSRQVLDEAISRQQSSAANVAAALAAIDKAQQMMQLHQAAVGTAEAEIAIAQWELDQTRIVAPVDGTIVHLTVRIGDEAVKNVPLIGLVDAHAWRIMANYKEDAIRHLTIGNAAWVWLDTYPWHFHRARIQGVSRGISRVAETVKLLPYVEPTTDWIRLQRRFPVTLVLEDPPPDVVLHMGADARTLIFY